MSPRSDSLADLRSGAHHVFATPVTHLNARWRRASPESSVKAGWPPSTPDLRHTRKVALKVLAGAGGRSGNRTVPDNDDGYRSSSGEADGVVFHHAPSESLRGRPREAVAGRRSRALDRRGKSCTTAHEQGDPPVKPANILLSRVLTTRGRIALAVSAAGGGRLTETGISPYTSLHEPGAGHRRSDDRTTPSAVSCTMLVGEPVHGVDSPGLGKVITQDRRWNTVSRFRSTWMR